MPPMLRAAQPSGKRQDAGDGQAGATASDDLSTIRQLTETLVVRHRGVIVERGRTQDVLDDPQHPYSQRLRASVPTPDWDLAAVRSALSAAG